MPTGMEMLVSSILKAAGVDAERAKADLANYGRQLGEKITSLDQSLVALRADQQQVYAAVMALAEQFATSGGKAATNGDRMNCGAGPAAPGEERQHAANRQ